MKNNIVINLEAMGGWIWTGLISLWMLLLSRLWTSACHKILGIS